MCSDRPRRRAGSALLAVALAAGAALGVVACGKQGDPQPRPRAIPQPATDLELDLRGTEVLLAFSYPTSTLAGLPLEGLETASVFEVVRPVAPGTTAVALTPADFEALGQAVVTLAGPSLADAVTGARIRTRLELPAEALDGTTARGYAVRTKAVRGEVSPWSNIVTVVPRPAPPAPEELRVEPRKQGVELTWSAVEGAAAYAVLRREAVEPAWGPPIAVVAPEVTTHVDRDALYGTRYVYTVVARAAGEPPIESAPRHQREVDYRDVYPPPAPRGVRAVALAEAVRLVWEPSADTDLAGYHVERAAGGGDWRRLTVEPLDALEHSDADAPRRTPLAYRVVATDRVGNKAASAPVEARRP
jgi:hypothetical protein